MEVPAPASTVPAAARGGCSGAAAPSLPLPPPQAWGAPRPHSAPPRCCLSWGDELRVCWLPTVPVLTGSRCGDLRLPSPAEHGPVSFRVGAAERRGYASRSEQPGLDAALSALRAWRRELVPGKVAVLCPAMSPSESQRERWPGRLVSPRSLVGTPTPPSNSALGSSPNPGACSLVGQRWAEPHAMGLQSVPVPRGP